MTIFAAVQLSIIIVNYNVKHFLEQCLCSVQAALKKLTAEVFVVDNNSTDSSVAYLQPQFPWVKWIVNQQNAGFGAANNQAVKEASGQYILFLNPDTLLPEDCLQKCLDFMELHPQAGALGIRMLDGSGCFLPESRRGFPSLFTSLFKMAGLSAFFPRSKVFARYYLGHLPQDKNHVAEVLAGAFMLVRQSVLQQTGAFDEQFFMYGEDIDLSYRIQQAGWQNWYFADSCIIHFKGESTRKSSIQYVKTFYEAMSLFVKKHYSGKRAGYLFVKLLQGGIWAKAGITLITSGVRHLGRSTSQKTGRAAGKEGNIGQVLIAASPQAFARVQQILQAAGVKKENINRIAPGKDLANSIGGLDQLAPLIKALPVAELVFCIDEALAMKTVITCIQQQYPVPYVFYYSGSRCLISSSSKESSGRWMAE